MNNQNYSKGICYYLRSHFALLIIFFFFFPFYIFSQGKSIDSLQDASLKYLQSKFVENYSNDSLNKIYAYSFFKKAVKEKDSVEIANGYYMRIISRSDNTRKDLYDSIITISKNFKNENFPTIAYYDKGNLNYKKRNFAKALDNYLLAIKYNQGNNSEWMNFIINLSVADIKLRIEENKEGLQIYKDSWKYVIENDLKTVESNRYFETLFGLVNGFKKTNLIDSAKIYTRQGIMESRLILDVKTERSDYYYHLFLLLQGVLEMDVKPKESIDKLNDVRDYFIDQKDTINLAITYQYKGRAHLKLQNNNEALLNFNKVDSLINDNTKILPELIYSFRFLKEHAKKLNKPLDELRYIEKIMEFDSVFKSDYRLINTKIKEEYDFPILLKDRDDLIDKLEHKNSKNQYIVWISIFLSLLGLSLFLYQLKLRLNYKKKFNEQMSIKPELIERTEQIKREIDADLNIPQNVIDIVISGLDDFEKNKGYLDSSINTNQFAKQLGTNNSYFTKVFKAHKNIGFSTYVKNLRLDYAFNRLKTDKTFRKFAIRAIALESGFRNSESFSKSFYKKYGFYPSYFIKQLGIQLSDNV